MDSGSSCDAGTENGAGLTPTGLTMETPEQNRRNDMRRRVIKSARIVFKNHEVTFDCVVRNLSDRGACLKLENVIGIPDSFELVIEPGSVRNCRVAWRKPTLIGVEFSKTISPAPHRSGIVR
jgi:hypothetical protein